MARKGIVYAKDTGDPEDLKKKIRKQEKAAKEFLLQYHHSPKFRERVLAQKKNFYKGLYERQKSMTNNYNRDYDDVGFFNTLNDLRDRASKEEVRNLSEYYTNVYGADDNLNNYNSYYYEDNRPFTKGSRVHNVDRKAYFVSKDIADSNALAAHELSHIVDIENYINEYDVRQDVFDKVKNVHDMHDLKFEETRADINAFRFLLDSKKIYDAGKEDFKAEHLIKALEDPDVSRDFFTKRLLRLYSTEDLIDIMNKVASNDKPTDYSIRSARKGGILYK